MWWDLYGKHIPHLSMVATTVLSQVISASAAERNWSIYGHVKDKGRSTLGHSKSDKLVYCRQSLALREKLQTASYKAKIEKWDSDSDSDESDDGDLKM